MNPLEQTPLTMATTKAGAAVGTTTTYVTANTTQYCIKGKAYSTAAKTNVATPVVDIADGLAFSAVPVSNGSVFTLCFDSGGTLRVTQGTIEALDASNAFINLPQFGAVPDTVCPFAYLLVKVGSTGVAWTFGTSNLSGPPTGVVFTFVDVFTMPDRPQAS